MRRAATLFALLVFAWGRAGSAQTERIPPGQIFSVDPVADGVAAVALVGSALLLDSNKLRWSPTDPCRGARRAPTVAERSAFTRMGPADGLCDSRAVSAFDRWSLGLRGKSAQRLSDALLFSLVTTPLVFSAIDTPAAGVTAKRLGDDAAVTFQTFGATYLATVVLKMMVARPRPLTYSAAFDKRERFSGSARLSFPSGHASLAFASASLLSVMLAGRFGDDPGAVAGITGAYLTAATVATCRVLSGKHFLSDVLVGAALGTALGLTIPLLHTKTREPSPTVGAARPLVGVGGVF